MEIELDKLPAWVKLEIQREDLLAFAEKLLERKGEVFYSQDQDEDASSNEENREDEILDFNQMRKLLRLARSTAYQKVSSGEIPHYKKGRRLYFKKSELQAYVESGRRKTKKELDELAQQYLQKSKQL